MRNVRNTCAAYASNMRSEQKLHRSCTQDAQIHDTWTMRDNFPRAKYMQNADAKKIQLLGNIKQNRYEGALIAQQLRSTCRQMLQRSIQSVLEVT